MPVTRPKLTPDQRMTIRLESAARALNVAKAALKVEVVEAKQSGASFNEIARVTGISTNTLQAWVRDSKG